MAKRKQIAAPRKSSPARTTSSGASTDDVLEERMLAIAEQLGRLAGTVQAKTAGWMDGDTLKKELARVRDGATDLLQQLTGDAPAVVKTRPMGGDAAARSQGRSGGVVDAPGKKHRPPMGPDPDASHVKSQAAKVRAAKTMVKTNKRRGRG